MRFHTHPSLPCPQREDGRRSVLAQWLTVDQMKDIVDVREVLVHMGNHKVVLDTESARPGGDCDDDV